MTVIVQTINVGIFTVKIPIRAGTKGIGRVLVSATTTDGTVAFIKCL